MHPVAEKTLNAWTSSRRTHRTPSGWVSGNSACCHHRGHKPDTRGRGGILITEDSIIVKCFNCSFNTRHSFGQNLNSRFRKFLEWIGVDDESITRLRFDAIKESGDQTDVDVVDEYTKAHDICFTQLALPDDFLTLEQALITPSHQEYAISISEYLDSRGIGLTWANWHVATTRQYRNRVIVPVYFDHQLVSWVARSTNNQTPKYIADGPKVFPIGLDNQFPDRSHAIVVEGVMDAIAISGIGLMGSELNPETALLIESLNRNIILVPDRDSKGYQLIESAIGSGWSVSFPDWQDDIHDVADAVNRYGRLYTLASILNSSIQNHTKIKIMAKKWCGI